LQLVPKARNDKPVPLTLTFWIQNQ